MVQPPSVPLGWHTALLQGQGREGLWGQLGAATGVSLDRQEAELSQGRPAF